MVVNCCRTTFRGYQSVAKPTNCVLSAKIKFLREKISTTQEIQAIADNRCYKRFFYANLITQRNQFHFSGFNFWFSISGFFFLSDFCLLSANTFKLLSSDFPQTFERLFWVSFKSKHWFVCWFSSSFFQLKKPQKKSRLCLQQNF